MMMKYVVFACRVRFATTDCRLVSGHPSSSQPPMRGVSAPPHVPSGEPKTAITVSSRVVAVGASPQTEHVYSVETAGVKRNQVQCDTLGWQGAAGSPAVVASAAS